MRHKRMIKGPTNTHVSVHGKSNYTCHQSRAVTSPNNLIGYMDAQALKMEGWRFQKGGGRKEGKKKQCSSLCI